MVSTSGKSKKLTICKQTIYSSDFIDLQLEVSENGVGHYKGDIFLALKYQPFDSRRAKKPGSNKGELHVLLKEAHNLTPTRSNGTSDPFCKR